MNIRPRRNRKNQTIRQLVSENHVTTSDLIFPLFLIEGNNKKVPIESMPGINRYTIDYLLEEVESCLKLGITSFAPFPAIKENLKDKQATAGSNPKGLYPTAIKAIKDRFPEAQLFTDVAMDPYSSDGHDGYVENGQILNDPTLPILAKMAITQAEAGSDCIAPSDMMDGRIGYIRQALDKAGFQNVSIMAYTAKYASAFYGPFRDALDSAPKAGDKKTYQMDPSNRREALREIKLDEEEGADFLMIKPGLPYLDIVSTMRQHSNLPIAVYNVSGEYAMVKAAAEKGWIDEAACRDEMLLSFKRAGADIILTYFAKTYAAQLKQSEGS